MEGKTRTNHAGGIVGGLPMEMNWYFVLPLNQLHPLQKNKTVELGNRKSGKFFRKGRHDLCVALQGPVILEAVTAIALIDLVLLEQQSKRVII